MTSVLCIALPSQNTIQKNGTKDSVTHPRWVSMFKLNTTAFIMIWTSLFIYKFVRLQTQPEVCRRLACKTKEEKKQKTMQNITDLNGSIPAVPEKWLCLGCHNKCKSNIDIIKYYVTSHLSRAAEPWNFRFMPKSITMENIKVKPFTYAKISWQNQSTAHLNFMQSMLHYQPKPRSSPQLYL